MPQSHRKIVTKCAEAFESGLIDSIEELVSGIEVSGRQSSYSSTTVLRLMRGKNITIMVQPRVRAPREGIEFEVHMTDDRQLEMGWIEEPDEEGDELEGLDNAS